MYLVCVEGSLKINGTTELVDREAAELICATPEARKINLKAQDDGMHVLCIEMTQK